MSGRLPGGVEITKSGRYRVSVRKAVGSSDRVTMSFDSRGDALLAHAAGMRARENGDDVRRAMESANPSADAKRVRTFGELLVTYEADRRDVVQNSDHTLRCSKSKGRVSFRPSSFESDMRSIKARIVPWFSEQRLDQIDSRNVQDWLLWMAKGGVGTSTAQALLIDLRFIVGNWAKRHEQNEDFPWRRCVPVVPANPKRRANDPSKWGGFPGSKPPLTPLSDIQRLAMELPAASRITIYIEALTGHRLGESQGLKLSSLRNRDDGYMWARIEMQRNEANEAVPWVKTDDSYRDIPLPSILSEYIEEYTLRYHGYDFLNPDPTVEDRHLVVAPNGRDVDGSFLPACRSTARAAMRRERERNALGFDDLGYSLNNQHLRRVFVTYAEAAQEICEAIVLERLGEAPSPTDKTRHARWIAQRDRELAEVRVKYEPRHVSAYCGHEHDNKRDNAAASKVTVKHYQLASDERSTRLRGIADAIDLIARHEMGSLLDEPDPGDLLEVMQPDDPHWMLPEDAASRIGMNVSNVYMNIKRGRLEAKTVWLADGGYTTHSATNRDPAVPRTVISVESIDGFIAQRSRPTVAQAAALLGMTTPTIRANYLDTGLLPYDGVGTHLRVDPIALGQIHTSLLDGVIAILHAHGPLTPDALRDRFNATNHPM